MFCRYCGKEIPEDSRFCQHCGKPQEPCASPGADGPGQNNGCAGTSGPYGQGGGYYGRPPYYPEPDIPNAGWGVLGFFFPLIGLILYLVWQQTMPNRARMCGKGALISVIVVAAFFVLFFFLIIFIAGISAAV